MEACGPRPTDDARRFILLPNPSSRSSASALLRRASSHDTPILHPIHCLSPRGAPASAAVLHSVRRHWPIVSNANVRLNTPALGRFNKRKKSAMHPLMMPSRVLEDRLGLLLHEWALWHRHRGSTVSSTTNLLQRANLLFTLTTERANIPAEVATVFCGNEGLRTSNPCISLASVVTPHAAHYRSLKGASSTASPICIVNR